MATKDNKKKLNADEAFRRMVEAGRKARSNQQNNTENVEEQETQQEATNNTMNPNQQQDAGFAEFLKQMQQGNQMQEAAGTPAAIAGGADPRTTAAMQMQAGQMPTAEETGDDEHIGTKPPQEERGGEFGGKGGDVLQGNMNQMEEPEAMPPAIGKRELRDAMQRLRKYKNGKSSVERRIIESQQWWKLRNWEEIEERGSGAHKPASAWLWSSIIGKHADAVEAMPEPVILPRAMDDEEEANRLSKIVPVVMEQNDFGETYDSIMLQKAVEGTGIYGVFWDKSKLGGLGDITIRKMEALNLYWEPGVQDIQQSRDIFNVSYVDRERIEAQYPETRGKLRGKDFTPAEYRYDDNIDTSEKVLVVDWYYKRWEGSRHVLHYCKFVGEEILFATENDPEMRSRGLYDDGDYPFIFDTLYDVAGSPCGYGYVDVGKDTQTSIDLLNQAMVRNAVMSATPRYFVNGAAKMNEEEFADWSKPLIHVSGNLGGNELQAVQVNEMSGNLMDFFELKTDEIKFITGNMDVQNGGTTGGVTSATGLMAQMEAAGRSSKDANRASYRAYARVVNLVIERIRQFYDMPRQFRITGEQGKTEFVSYDNRGIKPQAQGQAFGQDMGYRLPVFDIDVRAQKEQTYTKVSQNDLALQFFQLGFFQPQMADQALATLGMMDFKGREEVAQKIQKNSNTQQMLAQFEQIALALARKYEPDVAQELNQLIMQQAGQEGTATAGGAANLSGGSGDATKMARSQEDTSSRYEEKAKSAVQNATGTSAEEGGAIS